MVTSLSIERPTTPTLSSPFTPHPQPLACFALLWCLLFTVSLSNTVSLSPVKRQSCFVFLFEYFQAIFYGWTSSHVFVFSSTKGTVFKMEKHCVLKLQ